MSEKDGGLAFPSEGLGRYNEKTRQVEWFGASQGMSLRDHFAGQIMAGMNSALGADNPWPSLPIAKLMAQAAYQQADAMLAERAKGQPVDPVALAAHDLLAAAEAQEAADAAMPSSMTGPEHAHWQALEEKAGEMRRAAIAKARGA